MVRSLFLIIRTTHQADCRIDMKDINLKHNKQTTWYENGQLIESYLKRFRKTTPADEAVAGKKLSLLEMLKASRTRDKNS